MDHVRIAADLVRSNRYLTLATSGPEGPWASPLAFTVDPDFSFVFYSATASIHAQNISQDARISGAIFNSTASSDDADGLQFRGHALEVSASELPAVMDRYFVQSFPDTDVRRKWSRPVYDFQGEAPQRFYRLKLQSLFKLDPTSTKVDKRIELDLSKVASEYFSE